MKAFSLWLLEGRKASGMTQLQLAKRVLCSKSYISTLERGATHSLTGGNIRPSEQLVEAFASALNLPVDSGRLAAGYSRKGEKTESEKQNRLAIRLDKILERVPNEKRREVENYLLSDAERLAALFALS